MDIAEVNLHDLVSRFFETAPARKASDLLEQMRDQNFAVVDKPTLDRLQTASEQLSRFYGLVELGFIARFISTKQLPSNLRDKWLTDLSDPIFVRYCDEVGHMLPILLRYRLKGTRSLEDARSEALIPLYLQFLEVSSLLNDEGISDFLTLIKASKGHFDVDTCTRMLASPAKTTLSLLKPELLRTRNDQFILGIGKFLDFCRELDRLLEESTNFPLLQSGMWHYHLPVLSDWNVNLLEMLNSSFRIMTERNHIPYESVRGELGNIENVCQVLERLTSNVYGDALEKAGNVQLRSISLSSKERSSLLPKAGPLISLEGIKKVYFTDEVETHALEEIFLKIKRAEYISIAGPSGCGKSTLLSILGLLDSPTEGNYELNGQPVAKLTISERTRIRNREIGFIFQAFNLIGDLTVYENIELPLTYRGTNSSERKQKVQNALERVGMAHRLRHYPSQLSGGQQQRVAVARALVGDPLILMADEPTGNLDSKNGEAVMELLRDLHRNGATICMVTHDQRYANFAERTIHLFDGRIVEETQEARVGAN